MYKELAGKQTNFNILYYVGVTVTKSDLLDGEWRQQCPLLNQEGSARWCDTESLAPDQWNSDCCWTHWQFPPLFACLYTMRMHKQTMHTHTHTHTHTPWLTNHGHLELIIIDVKIDYLWQTGWQYDTHWLQTQVSRTHRYWSGLTWPHSHCWPADWLEKETEQPTEQGREIRRYLWFHCFLPGSILYVWNLQNCRKLWLICQQLWPMTSWWWVCTL